MTLIKDIENLGKLKEKITALVGFDCSKYSDAFLVRRISVRLRANQYEMYLDYIKLLENNEDEREMLHKELTIHVTNFFRDKIMWDLFKKRVIPVLIEMKKTKQFRTISVWSAGCSSGEEPLSIAICFLEILGPRLEGFDIRILGTDINAEMIETAKAGLYEEQQFSEMNPDYLEKYFEKVDDNIFRANKEIMNMVRYKAGDILSDPRPFNVDIVFCRNTVIYFSVEAKSRLYEDIFLSLNNGGFFILGRTEILQGPARQKFTVFDSRERIYHKDR